MKKTLNVWFIAATLYSLCSTNALADTVPAGASNGNIIPIDSVISQASLQSEGFMTVYRQNGAWLLEVPDSVLGRDILVTITVTRGALRQERTGDMRFGYGGDSVYDKMIRLVKRNNNIDITVPEHAYTGDTTALYKDYLTHLVNPISHTLTIMARSNSSSLIDITQLLNSNDNLFSLAGGANELKLGGPIPEYTKISSVRSFPRNINFTTERSYQLREPAKGEKPISHWEVCSSWLLLPKKPMLPVISDTRVGYFTTAMQGLGGRNDYLDIGTAANHWRLEPREEDLKRYLSGELVEPKQPIIYYIDPATPDFLKPAFIRAVDNWKAAFERAGFKNAIHAELAPTDSTYSQGDVRYPLISYKASPIPNAYGPMVVDPRSGEVITTHIGIYHSVLELVQRWYFVMCSQVDPKARQYPLDRETMCRIVESVVSHEVGHTLGLRHNFLASTAYAADSLRLNDFITRNGLGASIMDYQRFNYIAQPGDNITLENLLPRISEYDKFAIEWAYRYRPGNDIIKLADERRAWTTAQRAADRRLLYIEESTLNDPRIQSEDASADVIQANTYGMKNLQFIMQHLEEWTPTTDEDYYALKKRYHSVLNQYWNYIRHIIRYVGGSYDDNADREESQLNIHTHVSRSKQLEALAWLNQWLIKDQEWLHPAKLMAKTGVDPKQEMQSAADQLGILLLKYSAINTQAPRQDDLIPEDLVSFIYEKVYTEKNRLSRLSIHDCMLQKDLLSSITMNAENFVALQFNIGTRMKLMLEDIKASAMEAAAKATDYLTRCHHQAIVNFVTIWQSESNRGLKE